MIEKGWEGSSSWNYYYQWLDHHMCLSPGELQLVKWGTYPMRRKTISDLFCKKQSETENRDLAQKSTMLCLAEDYPQVSLWLLGNWGTETEIAAGHWEATSGRRTRLWLGGDRCTGCTGRKHQGKGRCVQNNKLGFAQHWANPLQDRKSVCMCGSRSCCFMPSFRLPLS